MPEHPSGGSVLTIIGAFALVDLEDMVFFGGEQVSRRKGDGEDSGWCGTAQDRDGLVVDRRGVRQALLGSLIRLPCKKARCSL